ncbi:unnamed protein product [Rotaria magnacalcarata]|uniref:Uncharacterized protein n=2 Tax=Rotaria magnacalcarata TaxID=392030 RepID=A0A819YX99_9BILA|nr:unnamed protein product [Rotaria magnacalcarata]
MDNIPIEQLIAFSGETFYQHVQEHYSKNVEMILRFHDIDNYLILGRTSKQELLETFEKPNDENDTRELIDLKSKTCNISEGKILLKIGTKNKMILLLKSAQHIVNKRKRQFTDQAKLNRLNKHRSSSSSLSNSSSDAEMNMKKYATSIEESIGKILTNMKNHIHGHTYVNMSANAFGVMLESINDQSVPSCSVQCICGDRIKLFFNHNRFQLSNLIKHLRNDKNKSKLSIKNTSQDTNDQEGVDQMDQMDVDEEPSTDENNLLTTQNTLNKHVNNNTADTDNTAAVTIKTSYSQKEKPLNQLDGNTYNNTSPKATTINRDGSQRLSHILATGGGTQSSISYISSSKSKQQLVNKEQPQTENVLSNNRSSTNVKDQNTKSNDSSQSKKRKINENDKQIRFYSSTKHNKKKSEQEIMYDKLQKSDILFTFLNTIDLNRHRPPNNYRYPNSVLRFATCFFILAGVYVYEYVRINLKFLFPSVFTVKKFYTQNPYSEARFRFDECVKNLNLYQCQYIFMSEDCSAIIPRVEYDSTFNVFNGLVTPILNGVPTENFAQFNSFDDLKQAIEITPRSNLVNVHLVQPISTSYQYTSAATVLSAYGTDNKINSIDVLKRWLYIYQQFYARNVRVLGYATDGDPKYLRAMRLASNFFVKTQTLDILNDKLPFTVKIPSTWSIWYFLGQSQLFIFLQDGTHVCTKIRNRLLSKHVQLKMGSYKVSIKHLYDLIKNTNKIDHNLSKSDLNIRDKQNFTSCQRISSDSVLNLLMINDQWKATYNYMLILNLIWLRVTKQIRKSSVKINKKSNEQNDFITSNALISIELNAHSLIYLYLLIEHDILPQSAAGDVHLFSSQHCENIFRDARSLSGIYSTRINFTMKQFLKRIDKLNALTELKQFELTNEYDKIIFPVHHKIKGLIDDTGSKINEKNIYFHVDYVGEIIFKAYEVAQQMAANVGMNIDLIKNKLFDIQQSSQIAKQLLKLNSLTEEETLVVDDKDSDEEEDDDEGAGDEEEDDERAGDEEEDDDEGGDDEEENDDEGGDDEEEEEDEEEEDDEGGDDEEENDDERDGDDDEYEYEYDIEEEDDVEANDEGNGIEELNNNNHDHIVSQDDSKPTPSFENVQATSYSGAYQ